MNLKTTFLAFALLLMASTSSLAIVVVKDSVGVKREKGQGFILHRVERGETLSAIAKKYKVSVKDIQGANAITGTNIRFGQVLRVPDPSFVKSKLVKHVVKGNDTLYGIAKLYNVRVEDIKELNKMRNNRLYKDQYLWIRVFDTDKQIYQPPSKILPEKKKEDGTMGTTTTTTTTETKDEETPWWVYQPIGEKNARVLQVAHTIQPGETLAKIAQEYGVTKEKLISWNAMTSPDNIKAGDRIIVGYEYVNKKTGSTTVVHIGDKTADPDPVKDVLPTTDVADNQIPMSKKSTVMGAMIRGNSETETNKHLALHRTAKRGSYIKITNPDNGKSTFVRVLGNLQNVDTDRDVIIKLSKSACQAIGVVTDKFPVVLEYNE